MYRAGIVSTVTAWPTEDAKKAWRSGGSMAEIENGSISKRRARRRIGGGLCAWLAVAPTASTLSLIMLGGMSVRSGVSARLFDIK